MIFFRIFILFLSFCALLWGDESQNDFERYKLSPNQKLKVIIFDSNMKMQKIIDVPKDAKNSITLDLPDDEQFYVHIINPTQENAQKDTQETTQSTLAQGLKEAPITNVTTNEVSMLEGRYERNQFMGNFLGFEPYDFNYILPANVALNKEDGQAKHTEVKFQLSLKKLLADDIIKNLDLYFSYTQQSFWQLYDTQNSKPFRESNYMPSLYFSYLLKKPLFFERINFGYVHQSNGGDLENSRSWDRLFVEGFRSFDNFLVALKAWYRIPESAQDDDNPDIYEYLGYGDLTLGYLYKKHLVTLKLRNNLNFNDNKGAILLDYSYPIYKNIYFYMQFFSGYGESLADYNRAIDRVGVGLLFNR